MAGTNDAASAGEAIRHRWETISILTVAFMVFDVGYLIAGFVTAGTSVVSHLLGAVVCGIVLGALLASVASIGRSIARLTPIVVRALFTGLAVGFATFEAYRWIWSSILPLHVAPWAELAPGAAMGLLAAAVVAVRDR